MYQRLCLPLLCCVFASCWLGCNPPPARKLKQWKQSRDFQLPFNRFATAKIEPTLVAEMNPKGVWLDKRFWRLGLPPWLQRQNLEQTTREHLPVAMVDGIMFAKSHPSYYLIPVIQKRTAAFAALAKKAARTKKQKATFPFLRGFFEKKSAPNTYKFRGRSTLYFDRNMTFRAVSEVLYSMRQAGYSSFAFAACTNRRKDGQCDVKSFPLYIPRMYHGYRNIFTVLVHKNGFMVTKENRILSVPFQTQESKGIPKQNGRYNYRALSLYLKKKVIAQKKLRHRSYSCGKYVEMTTKGSVGPQTLYSPSTLRLLNNPPLADADRCVIIQAEAEIPYHVLLSVFAATEKTPDGKYLLPGRILDYAILPHNEFNYRYLSTMERWLTP
ncbi:MAG: hypothetical protein EP343_07165 [Deltaproteobacteria bacterium]|nr:MAG: hypothetical protein EP343_07165 [Deltaproteobacteria bacterium]